MRIVQLITRSDTLGGAQVHVRDLSARLAARGHAVEVWAGGAGPFASAVEASGVPYRALRHLRRAIHPFHDLLALAELLAALRAHRPDLLATHSAKAGWLGRVAGRLLGIPTVFTAHGWTYTAPASARGRAVLRIIERATARLATRIITVSDYDRHRATTDGVADAARMRVVHNGVPDVPPDLRRTAFPPRAAGALARLVTVARLQAPKDFPTLLAALERLTDLPWTLDVVGDGPLDASIRADLAARGMDGRVRLLGLRADVDALVAPADVLLLVSHKEGFPLSVLEAMRAGVPVVASDVGGVREAVGDGETGLLVPRADASALAAALHTLLLDPALGRRMGEAGRARFAARFTADRMVDATEAVYHEARAATPGAADRRSAE